MRWPSALPVELNVTGRRPRVAVLDDDPQFMELMEAVLTEEGFRFVRPPPTGVDPVEALADARADLVMLDLRGVGEEGGLVLLHQIRTDPRHERLPVLVCSADVKQLRDHAADLSRMARVAVLEKPFRIETLAGVLQALLDGSTRIPVGGGVPDSTAGPTLEAWLAGLGRAVRWPVMDVWVPDRSPGILRCAAAWVVSVPLEPFAIVSRRTRLPVGAGVPGRVWMSRRATWIEDLAGDLNFPRRAAARRMHLVSAAAVPVFDGDELVGVVAAYDTRQRRPEPEALDRLRRATADTASMLRAAAGGAPMPE